MSQSRLTIEEDPEGRGAVVFAVEDYAFSGLVGSFAHGASHSISEYSVVIDFGDGTTAPGSLTGDSTLYYAWLTAPHTYFQEGAYAIVTEMLGPDVDVETAAFAAGPALVFSKQDDAIMDWASLESGFERRFHLAHRRRFPFRRLHAHQVTTITGGSWSVSVSAAQLSSALSADVYSSYSLSETGSSFTFS